MEQFAKVFDFPTGQLLVYKNHNVETERDEIVFRTDIDGCQVQQVLSFEGGERVDEIFNRIDFDKSAGTYNHLYNVGKGSTIDVAEPRYSAFNLGIQVENMRNAQKMYFKLIGKARRTKHPEDLEKAETMKKLSISLEASVDDSIREIMNPVREVIPC